MLDKNVNLPLYLQVKGYIQEKIAAKDFLPGDKLPTERSLAKELNVSRNTVSEAYKELLLDGVLISKAGRGTFLLDDKTMLSSGKTRMDKLSDIVTGALSKAYKLGFSASDFMHITQIKVREWEVNNCAKNILVVDTSVDLAYSYAKQLKQVMNCHVDYVCLSKLSGIQNSALKNYNHIVIPKNLTIDISAAYPELMTQDNIVVVNCQVAIAMALLLVRMDFSDRVGIISDDYNFFAAVKDILAEIGIFPTSLQFINCNDDKIMPCSLYITSLRLAADVMDKFNIQVHTVTKEIDQGSIQMMVSKF